jgi:hypothetical protein
MTEGKGFTVRDRRGVKIDTESAETKRDPQSEAPAAERKRTTAPGSGSRQLPPVDFTAFLVGLGQMALMHLGELPEPGSETRSVDLAQARHSIDILDMLEQKTQGNLTEEEATLLRTLEGELKMKYVKRLGERGGAG